MAQYASTSYVPPDGNVNVRRRMKAIPALAALAFIGIALMSVSRSFAPLPVSANNLSQAPANDGKDDEQAAKAVKLAKAFIDTLDDKLRAQALFDFESKKKSTWSNLPVGNVPRNGARLGDMTTAQRDAAMELMRAVLSKQGYKKITDIMNADEELKKGGGGKGGKGGTKSGFGNDVYFIAIFGTPSTSQPWYLQFGGHHLGLNVTIVGKTAVVTPTHTGVQPASFEKDGKTVRALGGETDKGFKLINSLDEKQQAQAILKQKVSDLILGPGKDGKQIEPQGIKASSMSPAQQALLWDVVGEWVNIVDDATAAARMAEIKSKLDDTYFAWSGPTKEGSVVYYRVQGPTLVIEFADQGNTNHIHTIIRDPSDDYGKKTAMR